MMFSSLLLLGSLSAPVCLEPVTPASQGDLFALKARRVELGNGEVMEHAVLLVENGTIVTMGQDLPIERGIPVIELDDDQIVMPGLINPYTRFGMSGSGFNDSRPQVKASDELYPSGAYETFLEYGFTTIAQYPAGQGIPGQAVALKPKGADAEDMTVEDGVYVKVVMRNSSGAKRNLTDGFKKARAHLDKVKSEREKFDKKNSKKSSSKKSSSKKDDDKKDDDKKTTSSKSKSKAVFKAPVPDARVKPFLDLMDGNLQALVSITSAAAYEHLVDAVGDEEFKWHLRIPLTRDINVFHVKDKIGKLGGYVMMEPLITLMPGTLRQRNLPAEFDRAGAKLILIPRRDSEAGFKSFLEDVGVMISAGLDRKTAVRSLTHNAAAFLGLDDRVGHLAEGRQANLLIFSGDPFEPGTKIDAVMLDGKFVQGEIDQ